MFSIKKRLFALTIVVAVISTIVVFVSFSTMKPIKEDWHNYVENVAERQILLGDIKSQFGYGGAIHNFKNYVLRGTNKYYDRIKSNFSALNRTIEQYKALEGISAEESNALDVIKNTSDKYNQAADTVRTMYSKGKTAQEIDKSVKINDAPAIKGLKTLLSNQAQLTAAQSTALESQIHFSQKMLLVTIVIAVVLVLVIIIALSRSILAPLSSLQETIQKAQQENNLSIKCNLSGNDEIASIGQSFDNMMETFRQIIQNIGQSTSKLSSDSTSLAKITEQSSTNILTQQEQTNEVAHSIEQINQAVNEVVNSLAKNSSTADETNKETLEGKKLLQKTIDSIELLSQQIEKSTQVIHQLNTNSEQINGVVDVIRGIAEQTNLLALNAAIEAARAGEQGRGFAVVADEVRTLAGRTQESTEEINQMVLQLQNDTSQAVNVMSESTQQAGYVVEQATQAGSSLDKISKSIEVINFESSDIASVTTQQSQMLNSINQNITQINEMSTQTAEVARQSTSTSENMASLADELKQTANQFQV